ncbi:GNAT family N-acetyltransferase [Actinopolymorpha singaporensis]
MGAEDGLTEGGAPEQLRMLWPAGEAPAAEATQLPDGYALRQGRADQDVPAFRELMARVELGTWDDDKLTEVLESVVPDGWHLVVHEPTGMVVATGMSQRRPVPDLYPNGHEVGWIAAHPDHSGRGLGRAVTAAATARLVELGAKCVYLQTDDFRLPALHTYLRLGFRPHLWAAGMVERWREICERLGVPLQPAEWPVEG